ncbi:MAG: hypothetical protein IH984_15370 [Planctomycetes bacterium]|nr:hypothetical protein [Planctomycetota bacterium]
MMPQYKVFALIITTSISALAYPAFYSTSDNLPVEQEVAAIDTRTTTDIYQEFFGSAQSTETPAISDELSDRLLNGAWYNTPATDQGNSGLKVLNQALSIKPKAVKRSSTGKSSSKARGNKTNKQLKRYRNQTKFERTRNRTVTAAASRIKQSNRNRQLNTVKKRRQRERSRGYLLSAQKRSKLDRTRRFRHTRTGTMPGY